MRKVAGVLSSYEHSLTLPERAAGTVQAFARLPLITGQLAELQQLTSRQSGLLEVHARPGTENTCSTHGMGTECTQSPHRVGLESTCNAHGMAQSAHAANTG